VANPVDMLAAAPAPQYHAAAQILAADPNVDAIIAIFLPTLSTAPDDVAATLTRAGQELGTDKPLVFAFMSASPVDVAPSTAGRRVAAYALPEQAAVALAHAWRYAAWRALPVEPAVRFDDVRAVEARLLVGDALRAGRSWLAPDEVRRLLECYGVTVVEQRVVDTPAAAASAAAELGGSVALKAIVPGVIHKSDVGAVRLHLAADAVEAAAVDMSRGVEAATGHRASELIVQRMAPTGAEMLVGVVHDLQFGPTVACGAGGTLVELLHDVSVRLAPLTRADAASMLRELRSFALLDGYRGAPRLGVGALEDVVLRLSALAEDHPQIAELDCNPVVVTESTAVVVDARVRIARVDPPRPLGARR
jgi:acyl-CoA synthetase (NDP forming)